MQRLGKQIEYLRTRLGMTQGDLAEGAQLTRSYVRNLEKGREIPSLEILVRLAVTLRAEPWEMFFPPDGESAPSAVLTDEPAPRLH